MKPQKVRVLAEKNGQIVAIETVSLKPEHLRYAADDHFAPLPDQIIYELDVPKELAHHDIFTLHRELFGFQIEARKGATHLVRKHAS